MHIHSMNSRESMHFSLVVRVGMDEINGTRRTLVACDAMWGTGIKDDENLVDSVKIFKYNFLNNFNYYH